MPARVACGVCNRSIPPAKACLQAGEDVPVHELIVRNHPDLDFSATVCADCFAEYREIREALWQFSPFFRHRDAAIIPTPLRLHSDPRFTGRGVTIAFLDSGFYPHPDLTTPRNRIKRYYNVLRPTATPEELWRELTTASVDSWHGMMTSVVAAGNGSLSEGAYRGIASEAELVLVKVGALSRIEHDHIRQGIEWVMAHREEMNIRILNISCGGDFQRSHLIDPLCQAAEAAIRSGLVVVAAAGNRGHEPQHPVFPPASCPAVITVGGLDDRNRLEWSGAEMYRSSYGPTIDGLQKPEIIAPAIWLAGPILPGTQVADQAGLLIELEKTKDGQLQAELKRRRGVDPTLDQAADAPPAQIHRIVQTLIRQNNVISPDYKHVDGTSFAAPIVSSIAAQMLEADPQLTPQEVKLGLIETARRLSRVPVDQQGWGVVTPLATVQWVLKRRKFESTGG